MRLWHGGVPGLRVGDLIRPGHERKPVPGCKFCEARAAEAAGGPRPAVDPLSRVHDRVYLTTSREYARHYASLYGRGDLYRVEPVGATDRSTEDSFETYLAEQARVLAVYDRAVLLTPGQRRALDRAWLLADRAAVGR